MSKKKEIGEDGEAQLKVGAEMEKCPSCGSNLRFDPDTQTLYCEHCGTRQSVAQNLRAEEIDLLSGFDSDRKWTADETVVFRCDNCGAKVVLQKDETAKSCPFCGTAHVVQTDELAGLKPNGLIPFAFGVKKAIEFAKAWAKKRFYAPRKFKRTLSTDNVNGVYVPCFTFDSHTSSSYYGRIGKHHTRVVGSGKNRRTETYTVWRNISGNYFYNFDDVLITAGSKFDQKGLDGISPFDTNNGKAYEETYLLGFMAYHYDHEISECWGAAKNRMDAAIRRGILSQYSYDVVGYLNVSTAHEAVTYKYVMLPVYVGNYTYKKKLYNFYVNGSTGKVKGKTPVSAIKVILTILAALAVIGGVFAWMYFADGGEELSAAIKYLL